ncbi:MAG: class GN sortase [Proteobacteria bacterium]|nr:class GN sortase [Pseudomonadota bacterium]
MKQTRHWLKAAVLFTAAFFSLLYLVSALWIPAKAELAQWLIERSWQQAQQGNENARPWPWADTRAVGVLSVPGLGIRQIILEGNSGRNLAFGPVLLDGEVGHDLVISGHRDTHFHFLKDLEAGDRLIVQTLDRTQQYRVIASEIVDSRTSVLVIEPGTSRISLVTCYPFDAPLTGGPLRYVVTALPVGDHLVSSVPYSPSPELRLQQRSPSSR